MKYRITSYLFLVISLLLCFLYHFFPIGVFSKTIFDIGMIVLILAVVIFFQYSQNTSLKGHWLKPSNLFIFAFLAVNFQYLLDYRLGLKTDSSFYIFHPEVLNHCFILGLIGLLAFTAGYVLTGNNYRRYRTNPEGTVGFKNLIIPVSVLHVAVFAVFLYTIDISAFLSGEDYGSEGATYTHLEKLLTAVNAIAVACVVGKYEGDKSLKSFILSFPVPSMVVIGGYMLLRLVSGDRGPFVYTAIMLFYGYLIVSKEKYRLWVTVLVLAGGMLTMSLVGIARTLDTSNDFVTRMSYARSMFTRGGRFAALGEKSISPLTEELGFSFIVNETDVHAIEIENEELHPGTYLIISALNGIPFIPGLIMRTFHVSKEDFSSTGFANLHFFGGEDADWSIGTTVIGDFYLQFSVWGVLIGLFITGWLLKFLDLVIFVRRKETVGVYSLMFVLLFSSTALYIPRSLLLGELSYFIIAAILVFGMRLFLPRTQVS